MITISGGSKDDIMVLLQQDCPKCGQIWYEDLRRHKANGIWLSCTYCPDCGYTNCNKKTKDFDPSIIHAYNLDSEEYELG